MSCFRFLRLALISLCTATATYAWDWDDRPIWSDGGIPLHIQMGDSPTYTDGNTPNDLALAAAQTWNALMSRVQFLPQVNSDAARGIHNGINNVTLESTIGGENFPEGVLGVSISYVDDVRRTEADVIINSTYTWDSYAGALHDDQIDMLRVLIHELGHNLGLDHPDEAGQSVSALMNAYISDIDGPTNDEKDAIATFYGYTTANPGRAPELAIDLLPSYSAQEYSTLTLQLGVRGRGPFSYEWFKDGALLEGQTNSFFQIDYVHAPDAGTYHAQVTNRFGTVQTTSCSVAVTAPGAPVFEEQPASQVVNAGQPIQLSARATAPGPINYQWYKDGQPIDRTATTLSIDSFSARYAGTYYVTATNFRGTTTSQSATLSTTTSPLVDPYDIGYSPLSSNPQSSPTVTLSYGIGGISSDHPITWYADGQPTGHTNVTRIDVDASQVSFTQYLAEVANGSGAITTPVLQVQYEPLNPDGEYNWLRAETHNGVAYFLMKDGSRIERFDLAARGWLASIPLGSTAASFSIFNNTLYTVENRVLKSYDLSGNLLGSHITYDKSVSELLAIDVGVYASFGDAFGLASGSVFVAYTDLNTNVWVNRSIDLKGVDYSATTRTLYGMNRFGSSAQAVRIDSAGAVTDVTSFPDYQFNEGTAPFHLSPAEDRIVDATGTVNSTSTFKTSGFIGRFEALAFNSAGYPVTAFSGRLTVHDANWKEAGVISTDLNVQYLQAKGDTLFAFSPAATAGSTPQVRVHSLSSALARGAAAAVDPNSTNVQPDKVLVDNNGVHLLLARRHRNILRWNPATGEWLSSIPLRGSPRDMAYSAAEHAVYLLYPESTVTRIRLGIDSTDTVFSRSRFLENTLAAIDNHLCIADMTAYGSHTIFDSSGTVVSTGLTFWNAKSVAWAPNLRRLYYVADNRSPYRLAYTPIDAAFAFGDSVRASTDLAATRRHPIFVSPDEAYVATSGGDVYRSDLTYVKHLGIAATTVAWVGSDLVAAVAGRDQSEIYRFTGPDFNSAGSITLPGTVSHLAPSTGGVVVYAGFAGETTRTVLDTSLAITAQYQHGSSDSSSPFGIGTVASELPPPPSESVDIPDPLPYNVSFAAPSIPPPDPNAIPLVTTRLVNLSTRVQLAADGDGLLVAGFVIGGSKPMTALIRAVGPKLQTFGVPGVLPDPSIRVYNQASEVIAENNDWSSVDADTTNRIVTTAANVGAFALDEGSADAALLVSLPPGPYTAQVDRGESDGGVVLLELYDASEDYGSGQLTNLSTRVRTGSGDATLTAGFVVAGDDPQQMLVRASGPALTAFGVPGVLANPVLSVRSGTDEVASNDDWAGDAEVTSVSARVGAFPYTNSDALDSAVLVELAPGPYTAQVTGSEDGDEGTALVEVYRVEN